VPGEVEHLYLKQAELKDLYPGVVEDIDPKAPEPKGQDQDCVFLRRRNG